MKTVFEKPEPQFFADFDWLRSHHTELLRDYANQWVAATDGKVVAAGPNLAEVERSASDKCPGRKVPVMLIDSGRYLHG